jgi:hypothetical protein
MDFLNAYAEVATDEAALAQLTESFTRDLENAFEVIGVGNFLLGYVVIIVAGILGASIVMTAYIRMMALGERPSGLLYFRLGGREISVAITYLAVTLIAAVAVMGVSFLVTMALVAPFAGSESSAGIAVFGVFVNFIVCLVVFFLIFARFVVAVPASAIHGGVPIGQAWRATKGMGRRIAWILILGYLILFAVSMIALMILGMLTGLINGALMSMGSQLAPYFTGALWAIGYIAIGCLTNAFFVGLFTGVYMHLDEGAGSLTQTGGAP